MVDARPLDVRLIEYRDMLADIEVQLESIKVQVPLGTDTQPLVEGIKLYHGIVEDLTNILRGNELEPFAVVGRVR